MAMSAAWAESLTLQQARVVADGFMASRVKNAGALKLSHKAMRAGASAAADQASYYVFNTERSDGGFVIVAGDSRVPAVLGYSDSGSFDENSAPEPLKLLLDAYAAQIESLDRSGAHMMGDTPRDPIAPMVTAQWGQQAPFNTRLPMAGSSHATSGLGAVAMAQIMRYYEWPDRTTAIIPSYQASNLNITLPQLPRASFDWAMMKNCYMKDDTASMSSDAVATLVQYCAQALKTNFRASYTTTDNVNIPNVLATYFGFQPTVHFIIRENYSTSEWENMIYNELAQHRPVIYCASNSPFVCDGCDSQGLFHFNWGNLGQNNGYFRLNVLNTDVMGTGSTSNYSGFVNNQMAVVGIEPGSDNAFVSELTASQVTLNSYVNTRESFSQYFELYVSGKFYNYTSRNLTVDYGWGLFQGDQMLVNILGGGGYIRNAVPGSCLTHDNKQLKFGYNIPDGNYTIRQMYSERNAYTWHVCPGADKNYLDVVVFGDSCLITPHGNAVPVDLQVNSITTQGNMHPNRPIDITVNVTNNGESAFSMIYMSVNGSKKGSGIVSVGHGESTDVRFRFTPAAAGDYVLSFSPNENGSNPLATDTLHIEAMPAAKLTATAQPLNVTDVDKKIITDDKFALSLVVTNTATTPYSEDISVALFKAFDPSNPVQLRAINRHVDLEAGQTDTLHFELDGVTDGWQYFARAFYYSKGGKFTLTTTDTYTVQFPGEQAGTYALLTDVQPSQGGVVNFENGVSDSYAVAGSTVAFTVTPNEGYETGELHVVDEAGDTIPLAVENGTYRFTMPSSAVTVHVSFLAIHSVGLMNEISAGGMATVSADRAKAGDTITITARPNVGWRYHGAVVTCGEDTVPVSETGSGVVSFIMPDGDVAVTVNYERSTGDRFELVTDRDEITADGIYMIASRRHDKAMKFFIPEEDGRTFTGTDAGKWLNEAKSLLAANDQSCLFAMNDMRTVSIDVDGVSELFTMASLSTGNGYLTAEGDLLGMTNDPARRSAVISIADSACLLRIVDKLTQVPGAPTLTIDNAANQFIMASDADEPLGLYKLVDAHMIHVDPIEGGAITVTTDFLDDGTVQRTCEVNFTVQPEGELVVRQVTVTAATGELVEVVMDPESGVYSFVMPGSDVTISASLAEPEPEFIRGDVDGNRQVTMDDLSALINYLLTGNDEGINFPGADCDQVNGVTMDDLSSLINYLLTNTWQ